MRVTDHGAALAALPCPRCGESDLGLVLTPAEWHSFCESVFAIDGERDERELGEAGA